MLLFIVLFFGIGFLLNMILRMTWIMAIIYPIVVILIVDKVRFIEYFNQTSATFKTLLSNFVSLGTADVLILVSGLFGAVLSGIVIKMLRARGYQMF
ncbi:YuiB family protein [Bacillus solimangrovi]